MWSTFFFTALAVAGLAVIWRNWLEDFPQERNRIRKILFIGKAVTCGSCFTYWLSLIAVSSIDILPGFVIPWTATLDGWLFGLLNLLFRWMALAMAGVFIRFAYVLVQELVNYYVHNVNHKH